MGTKELTFRVLSRCRGRLEVRPSDWALFYMIKDSRIGGEGGIRTLGTFYRTPDFQSGPFDHSGTSP